MNLDVRRQLAELRNMTAAQLQKKHLELFGEPSRSSHREFLFRRLAWKVQALAEGELSQRARRRAMELAQGTDRPGRDGGSCAATTPDLFKGSHPSLGI